MIYVTGDCHGDWRRFQPNCFPEQKNMNRNDYVIVCGDFGIWHDTYGKETEELNKLAKLPFTILFVDGNHENYDRLESEFPEVNFHGGKAHKIRENVYHLERGYVFDLQGKKFFCFGGASSHDISDGILDPNDYKSEKNFVKVYNEYNLSGKMFRVKNISWWERELPNEEEMQRGLDNLKENNNKVDFIISHCAPQSIADIIGCGLYQEDILTDYFEKIKNTVHFTKWIFGHYHDDIKFLDNYILLYYQFVRIV